MAIKCGKGHQHETIAEVRACYGVETPNLEKHRANKYAGPCARCGFEVAAESGLISKNNAGKWVASHLPGDCPTKADVQAQGTWPKTKVPAQAQDAAPSRYAEIPRGHYATKSATGRNDYDFWRVDRPEQGTYAGRTFVKRIVGGKPDLNVSRDTRTKALEAILAEGIDVCGFRYGQELGACRYCNRHLTDEISRSLSAGPECRSKN
jgi:hypothetical protein